MRRPSDRQVPASAARRGAAAALAAVTVAVLGAVTTATGASRGEPAPAGSTWTATATALRGQNGSRFVFVCPAAGAPGNVWGTDVYTDDSSVCTAAVHAGAITVAGGGLVTIEIRPGQASYAGSTRNGVTTSGYGSWPGSYVVVSAAAGGAPGVLVGGGDWGATAKSYEGRVGSRYSYVCPAGGPPQPDRLWGTNVYTDDSSVCTAAVHVGLLTVAAGGVVTIEMRPGQASYAGSTHNGITSQSYGSWGGSFRFPAAAVLPGGTGGAGGPAVPPGSPPTGTATGAVTVDGAPFTGGQVPYNSTVDVTNGTLALTTETGTLRMFGAGLPARFRLLRRAGKQPLVELRLVGGAAAGCSAQRTPAASPPKVLDQLWADGKGRFRTTGHYAAATVRGTYWLTVDRCDGTLVVVRRGVVDVLDLRRGTTTPVPAGHRLLVRR